VSFRFIFIIENSIFINDYFVYSYDYPQTLEQLLERQWSQGSQFILDQAQHFDIASLLSCLHQLRSENNRLEERVRELMSRRDHLLTVNARLSLPANNVFPINGALSTLNSGTIGVNQSSASPVSAHSGVSAASSPRMQTNSPPDLQTKGVRVSSPAQAQSQSPGRNSLTFHTSNESMTTTTTPTQHSSQIYQTISPPFCNFVSHSSPNTTPSHSQYSLTSHQQSSSCIRKTSDKR
jgi:hypothetical protein